MGGVFAIISGLKISSKKGKLYLKFVLAAAIIAVAVYSHSALAAVTSAAPSIANATINGVPIANASPNGDGA